MRVACLQVTSPPQRKAVTRGRVTRTKNNYSLRATLLHAHLKGGHPWAGDSHEKAALHVTFSM